MTVSTIPIYYYLNDNTIELDGLINNITEAYINDATVTVTLIDSNSGDEIVGETWPLAMGYVSASNGKYRANLASTLTVTVGQKLKAKINVDAGANGTAYWEFPVIVKQRIE